VQRTGFCHLTEAGVTACKNAVQSVESRLIDRVVNGR
jgi:hypothetical protein